jgi:hypothetical protein
MEPQHGLIQKDLDTLIGVCSQCGTVPLHRRGTNKDGTPKLSCSNARSAGKPQPTLRIRYRVLPFWPDAYSVFQGRKRIGTVRETRWVQNGHSHRTWNAFTEQFTAIEGEYPTRAMAAKAIAAGTRRGKLGRSRISLMEREAA